MRVRRAELQDLAPLAHLFDHYRQFYKQTADVAAARAFLSERFVQKDSVIFVGSPDASGSLIGFAQLYPSFSSVGLKRLWILNDLFVSPEARQLGAAKKLIEACVLFASQDGARGLTLKTAVDNVVAQKLYEASGWKQDEKFLTYNLMF
jgi:ribosomal protein S18 acetylase RimI-like enzyme